MADYQIGDAVPLVYTISAAATVTLTITDPTGTVSTPTPTAGGAPPAVTYTHNQAATLAGTWLYRFVATGAVTDAEDGHFYVRPISTANVYATVPELKSRLAISATDVVDDSEMEEAILGSSREIDGWCDRHFWRITEARTFCPANLYKVDLGAYNDLVSVTSLKTDASGDGTFETTWSAGEYQLLTQAGSPNVNASPEPRPYTQIRALTRTFPYSYTYGARGDTVEVTGVWGWPAVPTNVRQACLTLAVETLKLAKEAPFGVAGFGEYGVVRVRDNPKVVRLLHPYQRYQVLVG